MKRARHCGTQSDTVCLANDVGVQYCVRTSDSVHDELVNELLS